MFVHCDTDYISYVREIRQLSCVKRACRTESSEPFADFLCMMVTLLAGGGDDVPRTVVRMSRGKQENATKPHLGIDDVAILPNRASA